MTIRALVPPLASKYLRTSLGAALTATLLFASASAQVSPAAVDPMVRAENLRHLVEEAEQQRLPPARMGYLWAVLANSYQGANRMDLAEESYDRALALLAKDPAARADYATALENFGSLYLELGHVEQARVLREKGLAIRRTTGDPLGIAISQQRLAEVELAQHRFKEAERDALAAYAVLSEKGQLTTQLSALVSLSYAQCSLRSCAAGLAHARLALQRVQESLKPDSVELGHVSMALGFALWKSGSTVEAEQSMNEGIRLLRLHLGDKSPLLMSALYEYRGYLDSVHRSPEVAAIDRLISAMRSSPTEAACRQCVSVYSLR